MKQTPAELIDGMTRADARGRVVFPMHEPGGYRGPTTRARRAVASSDGRLVSFCRLDPRTPARSRRRGAAWTPARSGIKLHPRAEQFTLHEPGVREIVAVAHERGCRS